MMTDRRVTGPCREPQVLPGSFEVKSGGGKRSITIHWSQLEPSCENGDDPGYNVIMHPSHSNST